MSKGKIAIGALFGAIAGYVAGILTAPKSGAETREAIKEKADEIKKDLGEKEKKIAGGAVDITEDIKEKVVDLTDRTKRAAEAAKKEFNAEKPNKA